MNFNFGVEKSSKILFDSGCLCRLLGVNVLKRHVQATIFLVMLAMTSWSIELNAQAVVCDYSFCSNFTVVASTPDCQSFYNNGFYTAGVDPHPVGTPSNLWAGIHAGAEHRSNEAFSIDLGSQPSGVYTLGFYSATSNSPSGVSSTPTDGRFDVVVGAQVLQINRGPSPAPWEYHELSFTHSGGPLEVLFDGTVSGGNSIPAISYTHITNLNLAEGTTTLGFCPSAPAPPCDAGTVSPSLTSTAISNSCPTETVDLTTITASNQPSGTTLTWHTATPATNANQVDNATTVGAGTYYAAFYDGTNDCYSGASFDGTSTTAVTVTLDDCCAAGSDAPILERN